MTDKIKRGDLLPAWTATLGDAGSAIDLTTALSIRVIGTREGEVVIDEAVTGGEDGVVTFDWPTGSTDEAGPMLFEVEVTWPGPKKQTFPPDRYLRTYVYPDLD